MKLKGEIPVSSDKNDLLLYEQKDSESGQETALAALQEQLSAALIREAEKDQQIKNLQEQIDYLTRKLFGKKSEKVKDVPGQMEMFNEAEMYQDPREEENIFPEPEPEKPSGRKPKPAFGRP